MDGWVGGGSEWMNVWVCRNWMEVDGYMDRRTDGLKGWMEMAG